MTPVTGRALLFSSDEEYKTASEGCRDSVDYSPLSPSPPTHPISFIRAKDLRALRSRSSPPTSRRNTCESTDSTVFAVPEELCMDKELQLKLTAAEKEIHVMRDEAHERDSRMAELLCTLEKTEMELSARREESEEARERLVKDLSESRDGTKQIISQLTLDLEKSNESIRELDNRLQRGIEENEMLYKKLRDVGVAGPASSSLYALDSNNNNKTSDKIRRMDSFSDLTCLNDINPNSLDKEMLVDEYEELKQRFGKVVNELKAMKKELRESYNSFDSLDLAHESLRQELERKQTENQQRLKMMADRIQDLTAKYSSAEKQVRVLKQKIVKTEKKRTISLKGKDNLQW